MVYIHAAVACLHVTVSVLMDVWMSQVMLWAVYYMHRLSRLDAWTQPQILRVRMPSRARFPERPWRETWQRKAIRQASKDTQRLPASPPPHHPSLLPPSCFLISTPSLLFVFIHTSDGGDGGMLPGRREWVHLQAIPLRGCKIASIWMDCQWPGGLLSPDSPSTMPASLWFSSPAPALGLQPRCVPSVPSTDPGCSAHSLGNLPCWSLFDQSQYTRRGHG